MKKQFILVGLLAVGFASAQTADPYSGRVGINTMTPSATLNIKSLTGTDATTKNFELENANGSKMITVLDNGSVGIGTETPKTKLDVEGGIRVLQGTPQGDGTNLGYAFGSDGDTGLFAVADPTNSNISTNLDLYVNNESRVNINQQGDVKVTNLAGDGDKIVMANNDGTLTKGVSVSNFATSNIYTADGTTNGDRTVSTASGFLTIKGNVWNPLVVNSEIVDASTTARGGLAIHPNDIEKRVEFATTVDGDSRIWLDGDKLFIKRATGNVGIGTNEPKAKLDVEGGIRVLQGTPQGDGTNLGYAFGDDGDTGLFAVADPTDSNISTNLDLYVNNESRVNINQQGDVKVTNLAGDGDKIVMANNDGTLTKGVSVSSFVTSNIYTANGSINENRTIEMNNSNLMFTGTGNVGIGTDAPVAKLDVAGTVKISDGTQGAGKVLTSNSDGVAHWALPAVTYQNYIGVFPDYAGYYPSTELSTEETDYSRTSFSFTLAPGKYQIFVNGLLSLRPNTMVTLPVGGYTTDWSDNAIVDSASPIFIRYGFKDSTADTESSNIYGGLNGYVGNMGYTTLSYPFDQVQTNFTTFIENNTSTPKTYYLYARAFRVNETNGKHHIIYDLFNGRWGEESITAVKIGD